MGQWGRQHEQVNCCFLETVSVHPTWSTQGSGRSRHHSSERRTKYSQRNKYRRRCPNGSAAYRCHHCGVGCECACWANGSGLEKKRGCEICLPRTSSGSGHSSPSCVFEKMLPGLLQLRSARFTKSALSRPSPPSPLPPLRLPPGAPLPFPHRFSAPQRSLPWLPPAPAVDPLVRSTPPPAPF